MIMIPPATFAFRASVPLGLDACPAKTASDREMAAPEGLRGAVKTAGLAGTTLQEGGEWSVWIFSGNA